MENLLLYIFTLDISDLAIVPDLAPVAFCADQFRGIATGKNSQTICSLTGGCTYIDIGGSGHGSDGLGTGCALCQLQELCLDIAFLTFIIYLGPTVGALLQYLKLRTSATLPSLSACSLSELLTFTVVVVVTYCGPCSSVGCSVPSAEVSWPSAA